jgi:hypothetical protein
MIGRTRIIRVGALLLLLLAQFLPAKAATLFPADLLVPSAVLTNTLVPGYSHFGTAVAFDGDLLAVGAANGETNGTVQIFGRQGKAWELQTALPGPADQRDFGGSVALQGQLLVAGNEGVDAWVFRHVETNWLPDGRLISGLSGGGFDGFAGALAVSGNTIAVGASRMLCAALSLARPMCSSRVRTPRSTPGTSPMHRATPQMARQGFTVSN